MTTRIFAAVVPPQPVIEELEEYVAPRREADSRLRWVWPEQWHLTTLFIDDCPDRSLDRLIDGLGEIASRTAPFTVTLRGGGCFPDPFAVRVLFLEVTAGADELRALSKTSRALASSVGAPPDGARFLPHLTLARTRTRIEGTRWLGVLDSFGQFGWQATELQVIRSHRGEGPGRRSRYERLAVLPLAGTFDKLRKPAG